jgi:poly(3-hydroxybutyrate) depolymerase
MKSIIAHLVTSIIVCGVPWAASGAEPASPVVVPVIGSSACGKPLAASLAVGKTTARAIASGGSNRSYLLHVPANFDAAKPAPLP